LTAAAARLPPAAAVANPLDWATDGRDWPHREASRFVQAGGLLWHVQRCGRGPTLLLLHGTGASTHSWRGLLPALAEGFDLIAVDLPGHGFSGRPPPEVLSLAGMAAAVGRLLAALEVAPALAVGHSAGAAVAARLALDGHAAPHGIVGINAALLPFAGMAGHLFAPLARLLADSPLVPRLFARHAAAPGTVERMLRRTGSRLDPAGIAFYRRLAASPAHVAAALGMMARWDLDGLARDLPRLAPPLLLLAGGADGTVPAEAAYGVRALLPATEVAYLRGLGHLAHEERPADVAALLRRFAGRVLGGGPADLR